MFTFASKLGAAMLAGLLFSSGLFAQPQSSGPQVKPAPQALVLAAPIDTWDEAVPLGNGLLGGLLWGKDNSIHLSLDRGDLWDERLPEILTQDNWNYATMRQLQADGNQAELNRLFDHPYLAKTPTKLPGGRLKIELPSHLLAQSFHLNLHQAMASVDLKDANEAALAGAALPQLMCFFSAVDQVAMLRLPAATAELEILRPKGLDQLAYPKANFQSARHKIGDEEQSKAVELFWMHQVAAQGLEYAIVVAQMQVGSEIEVAVTITSNQGGLDPVAEGRAQVIAALERGFDEVFEPHRLWWHKFWQISSVQIPEPALQQHYDLVKYYYAAASRVGAPPMPLQGVWTRDDGGLPPWKGDFHNDLNTQMTYLAYHTAGLEEAGLSFLDYQWQLLPQYQKFAKEFYAVDGAVVPGVATLKGQALGGWAQYSLSPIQGFWVGQSFYLHWRYTNDPAFLAQRAYPWLEQIGRGVANLLEEKDGQLFLPLSSSPEIHNNSIRAWLTPNSNYDLDLMRWGFAALAEMASALGNSGDATYWRQLLSKLEKPHLSAEHVLMFARDEPFTQSHRHHSHLMSIHPLGLLHPSQGRFASKIVESSLRRTENLGTQAWVGYSFSWYSCMLARVGRASEALRYLRDYLRAFTLRNGFHVNGDQIGAGLSAFGYRPFTLEGNFLAMQAVHEMLLQSWGEWVQVFPAVSSDWQDVEFSELRAEGGFVVSARRQNGRTVWVQVTATTPGWLQLRDPFAKYPATANREVRRLGTDYLCLLKPGQSLELTLQP
ncbi:MAG: glycoside hydrolase N-terminal domain-containing protein [Planctomycetes bacterium]|nr:glycoside hydrolase N-terminal domain-containing protein [Planctomycetota bacterium]